MYEVLNIVENWKKHHQKMWLSQGDHKRNIVEHNKIQSTIQTQRVAELWFFFSLGSARARTQGKKNLNLFLAGHLGSKNKHVPVSYTQVIKAKIKKITYLAYAVDMIRYDWLSSRASIKGKHDLEIPKK